jgi:hypothetical protein
MCVGNAQACGQEHGQRAWFAVALEQNFPEPRPELPRLVPVAPHLFNQCAALYPLAKEHFQKQVILDHSGSSGRVFEPVFEGFFAGFRDRVDAFVGPVVLFDFTLSGVTDLPPIALPIIISDLRPAEAWA